METWVRFDNRKKTAKQVARGRAREIIKMAVVVSVELRSLSSKGSRFRQVVSDRVRFDYCSLYVNYVAVSA